MNKCSRCNKAAIDRGLCSTHTRTPYSTPNSMRMRTSFNHSVYQTAQWRRLRIQALDKMPLCMCCKRHGATTPTIDIDHIIPIRLDPSLSYVLSNLQGMCKSCHSMKTQHENKGVIYDYTRARTMCMSTGICKTM